MARSSHTEEPRMGMYYDGGVYQGICGCVNYVVSCVVDEPMWVGPLSRPSVNMLFESRDDPI